MTKVEKTMKNGNKRYILFDSNRLEQFINNLSAGIDLPKDNLDKVIKKSVKLISRYDSIRADKITEIILDKTKELIPEIKENREDGSTGVTSNGLKNINFDKLAVKIKLKQFYKKASVNRNYDSDLKYGGYYPLVKELVEKGIYTPELLEKYSKEELTEYGKLIEPDRDLLLSYVGLMSLEDKYLGKDFNKNLYELPQERFLTTALYLNSEEQNRKEHVEKTYFTLSNLFIMNATPTMKSSGMLSGGLQSCFVLTTDDDLINIYNDNTDFATFSKNGAGNGLYIGKVRSAGSYIRGVKGVSSGVIPWVKQLDNTSVSVNQLGQRPGAIAVYLDVWHRDIFDFIDIRLNTGDPKKRAYNIFNAVTLPDLFMHKVKHGGDWFLFDPYETRKVMGFSLEDFYDLEFLPHGQKPDKEKNAFSYHYELCVASDELTLKTKVDPKDIMKKIMRNQLESGRPFMFYRDTVNRDNPNKDKGMIYSSNLCKTCTFNK